MAEQADLIIFGARGDLAGRKLFPALYQLDYCELLSPKTRIVCVARDAMPRETFLESLQPKLQSQIQPERWTEQQWQKFASRIVYVHLDFNSAEDYVRLAAELHCAVRIYYLATPPSLFGPICQALGEHQCLNDDSRIVLEKPIGHDLASSVAVNETVAKYFSDENTYRIDHYLGKETVQNLLVLRFANRFINTQWDQSCIDHVQITVAETVGIEGRWGYYDKVGQLRDMVQNHLMQLLCLVAMEAPNSMTAESIRDEKIKVLRALRPIDENTITTHTVRGQYAAGYMGGQPARGYLNEDDCTVEQSDTETFVAIKAHIDNWRWAGVPFYLRTGKRMAEKLTEVVISYKALPHNIFSGNPASNNRLVIRLQPNEGIEMRMVSKLHSLRDRMALVKQDLNLDFLGSSAMGRIPEAYERLFLDVISGDQSLFVGREEVEESWRWVDGVVEAWKRQNMEVRKYQAGSWGPAKSELLIEKDNRSWHG
ncbi:glucose-6-phosphate dehydrogenase [Spongiibacter sp. KMU-158]|uniref:Glucose-6-phosphate 1-dehydrogenase n=1 Tax=Spongiibacter pelagi TaxID=2760804 RepID=A0A927GWU2_9GAMM|nr:glucose-6-phosphate dehydrogenase [Spongiibacter pelagi]MBD2860116.1 glucose-6-phosphate dehydrogenase [Spongiibacter pelagi]